MAREMKDSGIEWIGEIPQKWSCHFLKIIIIQNDGGIWGDDPIEDDGEIVLRSTEQTIDGKWNIVSPAKRDLSKISNKIYYLCKKNDLLITKSSGSNLHIGKTTIVDDIIEKTQCYYSNFIQRLRLSQTVSAKYYWYILNSNISRSQFTYMQNTTSGIGNLNAKYIANLIVPEPPLQEQYCIEKYLDVKCAKLDDVFEKTRASIEEYKKLKQAIITQAVTKGIRGDREMKDSGIDWIGEIPSEWKIIRIKWVLSERKEKSESGEEEPLSMSQKYGIIPTKEMEIIPNIASSFIGAKIVYRGDLVFNKLKAHLGVFAVSQYNGLVSPDYAVYYSKGTTDVKYLEYLFKTPQYIAEFKKNSSGVGAGLTRLYTDELYSIYCLLPSWSEQEEIICYLNKKIKEIDNLIEKKEQYLSEIENYKKSLVYEYVTGKREVIESNK